MNCQKNQFFKSQDIPDSLWRHRATDAPQEPESLVLAPILVDVYREMLDARGLRQEAERQDPNDEGPQGGITVLATDQHFARNFCGSSARVQLVSLDPNNIFETTREALVRLCAGGKLNLLDIPCGAGAASATFLCLIAELRRREVLPRLPLRVTVIGGDISEPARRLTKGLFRRLHSRLRDYGVKVTVEVLSWDVQDEEQTTELVTYWTKRCRPESQTAVLTANFSAFLHNKVKQCAGPLRQILRFARIHRATVLWIEPQTNAALMGLFPGLSKHVLPKVSKLRMAWAGNGHPRKGECRVAHPVQRRGHFVTRAAALHLEAV